MYSATTQVDAHTSGYQAQAQTPSPHLCLPHLTLHGSPRVRAPTPTPSSPARPCTHETCPTPGFPHSHSCPYSLLEQEGFWLSLFSETRAWSLTPTPCLWSHSSSLLLQDQIQLPHPCLRPYRKLSLNKYLLGALCGLSSLHFHLLTWRPQPPPPQYYYLFAFKLNEAKISASP